MITIYVETHRVYGHNADGTPKIEKIKIARENGLNFEKFLKYLPFQGYVMDKIKISHVTELKNGKEIAIKDISKWVKMLNEVKYPKKTDTITDKLETEKNRNNQLLEKMAFLEKEIEILKQKEATAQKLANLRNEYYDKFKKKPYHGWDIEKLIDKLNS